jgi:hypothetical protein
MLVPHYQRARPSSYDSVISVYIEPPSNNLCAQIAREDVLHALWLAEENIFSLPLISNME